MTSPTALSARHSLSAQTLDVLTEAEVAAFEALVYSPVYSDMLMQEEVYGAWLEGELVGTVSWHAGDERQERASVPSSSGIRGSASAAAAAPRRRRARGSRVSPSSRDGRPPMPCRSSSGSATDRLARGEDPVARMRAARDLPQEGMTRHRHAALKTLM